MTEFGNSGSFGERIVMQCQICHNRHHDSAKEVYVQDPKTGVYAKKICPLCMCLDCVQTSDDPIRAKIRPLMMGQTFKTEYNLTVDEFDKAKGHTSPQVRNLNLQAPGPLNLKEAIAQIGGLMGLQSPQPPPRPAIGQAVACGCGKNASSKCIQCDVPLCMKCLKVHDCG